MFSKLAKARKVAFDECAMDDEIANVMARELDSIDRIREMVNKRQKGGSVKGKSPNINRGIVEGGNQLFLDYFAENPVYNERLFRRRFRMRKKLFLSILHDLEAHDDYFVQKRDCTGKLGAYGFQKMTAAMRALAYGCVLDSLDENLRMSQSTIDKCVDHFCWAIIEMYGDEYLREPTPEEIQRLLAQNATRGFPGMLGSLDCMHWEWRKCPYWLQGTFKGKEDKPSIILEAIADKDGYFWHFFFGMPGSQNDINVLNASPLIAKLLKEEFYVPPYIINGTERNWPIFLVDNIYPRWRPFLKSIKSPTNPKDRLFAHCQEGCRKDVERAFGILQSRFFVLAQDSRYWTPSKMHYVIKACVILHNMITKDEMTELSEEEREYFVEHPEPVVRPEPFHVRLDNEATTLYERNTLISQILMEKTFELQNTIDHIALKKDMVAHLWNKFK